MSRSPRRSAPRAGNPRTTFATMRRSAAVTLLCGLALLLGATPALAHTRLESSNPADGSSTATGPQQVSLTFSEPMQKGFATVTVIGPGGTPYQSGEVTAEGDTVGVAVAPLGPAGRYEIGYRVVSQDGHPVTGSVAFTLTAPGPAATTAAPTPAVAAATTSDPGAAATPDPAAAATPVPAADSTTTDGGAPVWPWIVGGVVLVAAGAFAALRLGRG